MDATLAVANLSQHFNGRCILNDFSLAIPINGFTVLIGPSGCGKTTLFNLLTGIIEKSAGDIFWHNQNVSHLGAKAAYMQQKDLLLPWLSLLDNAMLPAVIAKADPAESTKKTRRLFKRLGLAGFENFRPNQASGGMQKRCALVRTLMFEHEMVLLDEPLNSIDAIARRSLQTLLIMLQNEFKKTILMITHDIEEALVVADDLIVLSRPPMRILQHFRLEGPKPRTLNDTRLLQIKADVLKRLEKELDDGTR
jgi:ABC-type nitrate/sulfonate/bicarbonate transport system ATPase subunit